MLKAMMKHPALVCLLLLLCNTLPAQQLLLSDAPASTTKSALLELKATAQGLLLPRIADTTLTPLNTAPDGMIVYYTPLKSLLVRRNGYWSRLADSTAVTGNQWLLSGNTAVDSATRFLGTATANPVNFRTANTNRMIISSTGNVGIGTTQPTSLLQVKSGVANVSGVRLENLTSASGVTAGAGSVGVDASGNLVRTATAPVLYSAAGVVSNNLKIWADSVPNTPAGLPQVDISNAGFTKILSVQVTARGGADATTAPLAAVLNYTLSRLYLILVESKNSPVVLLGTVDGLELSTAASRIFVTVIGY
ncbi:hypothetical protein [Chitinophaga nivalis]|uniref:Uncharacterized protein n=1 Tax=Chitinophaga nivalis TaxID=2991709 RepID=A0ABT3IEE1_9BACT|nr:hypothetical protein [Chitinophaga nivalis]MCW3467983.1 hypothetical protein [Chitinophaga nivalis]MCW3482326.1 hypothetical protein [Chitinophaga nivalis]